jgi:hypothetical protein
MALKIFNSLHIYNIKILPYQDFYPGSTPLVLDPPL